MLEHRILDASGALDGPHFTGVFLGAFGSRFREFREFRGFWGVREFRGFREFREFRA